jgi:hypothetical protein
MTTLTVRSEIGEDGKLRLEVPCALPPGPIEVVLVVQPITGEPAPAARARSGLFVGRGPANLDLDALLEESNAHWKAKLADLET